MCYLSTRPRNDYIWAKQNPHFFEEVAQHPLHVMMWAGVTSELIIGPHFFDVSVTDESYLGLLSHWLHQELEKMGLLNSVNFAAHYYADMRTLLNNRFPLWT
jgi:isocitrate/isopropylmalate dehydrogenase